MKIKNNSFLRHMAVVFIFISLTFVMTYPLFLKINSSIPGFHSTDEPSVWYFWWLKYAHINKLDANSCQFLAYPFGQDYSIYWVLYPLWTAFKNATALLTNPSFAYNIEIILSFILSGLFFYVLMMRISENMLCSVFSAIIYAFAPYHFVRAWQHIGLAHIQWMPLFLFALFRLKDKANKSNIILAFLSLYLVFSFDLYYAYFSVSVAAIFISYLLLKEKKRSLKAIFWICIIFLVDATIFIAIFFPVIKSAKIGSSPSAWGFTRPFNDLFSQSARPLSYFLPASVHPLFGRFTEQFVGSKLYGMSFTEHTLYLGWTPLVLAFFAFKIWRKGRKEKKLGSLGTVPFGDSPSRDDFYIGFFVFLAVVAWLFSQPPWWDFFGIKIYMPSFFLYKILPMFRAYCRFGIVVMLAVAVLAGFGLNFILEIFKTQKTKIMVTILFCGLVLFEFWNYPPFKVIDLSRAPQVYYWLKEQPGDFVIAEYPLDIEGPNEMYKFFQTKHEKKIINGTLPGTYPNEVSKAIIKLSALNTTGVLKWMEVKYVLVHKDDYLHTELIDEIEELNKIPSNPGLKFIKTFPAQYCPQKDIKCAQESGPINVYEVVALPIKPEAE
ncbi:MAG: hypothetical protein Q8R31_05815 [Candidatus Omnitrophota bacterium]|nr:hypothetical protein [Candidatus Omnitrophota bacterium]